MAVWVWLLARAPRFNRHPPAGQCPAFTPVSSPSVFTPRASTAVTVTHSRTAHGGRSNLHYGQAWRAALPHRRPKRKAALAKQGRRSVPAVSCGTSLLLSVLWEPLPMATQGTQNHLGPLPHAHPCQPRRGHRTVPPATQGTWSHPPPARHARDVEPSETPRHAGDTAPSTTRGTRNRHPPPHPSHTGTMNSLLPPTPRPPSRGTQLLEAPGIPGRGGASSITVCLYVAFPVSMSLLFL